MKSQANNYAPRTLMAKITLRDVLKPIAGDVSRVARDIEMQIAGICDDQSPAVPVRKYVSETIRHIFKVPGKLLRPALVLLTAKAVNHNDHPSDDSLIKLGAAVELVHCASLIHDDIIDSASERRRQVSLNERYGNQSAVLVGDILYSQIFSLLTNLESVPYDRRMELLRLFSSITRKMCLGEIYEQRISRKHLEPSFEEYAAIIENKTASLMSLCCLSATMLSGGTEAMLEAMTEFGLNLGMAFQISDDYQDEDAVFDEKAVLLRKARLYAERAQSNLKVLEENPVRESLHRICDYVVSRMT